MSKLKAVKPKEVQAAKPKILIFGKPGVKKTWVSLDFPNPYYIDVEGGATREAYMNKLHDAGGQYLGREEGSQSFEEVIGQVKALATEKHNFKTLVIDSKSKLFNIELAKEIERLGDKDAFGASKKVPIQFTRRLINWLDRLDMSVILICHEKPMWANDKQVGVTYDGYDKLEYELDLTLNINKQGNSYKATVKKSRLPGFEDTSSFEWSYEEFANRYGKEVIEKAAHQITLATPEQVAEIGDLLETVKLPEGTVDKWLKAAGAEKIADMDSDKLAACITYVKNLINKGK